MLEDQRFSAVFVISAETWKNHYHFLHLSSLSIENQVCFEVVTSVTHLNECFVSSGLKMLLLGNALLLAVAWSEQENWHAECCLRLCRSPSWLWCG